VNHLLDDDDADPPGRSYARQRQSGAAADDAEREISLGTPAILGIFFALALLCACFFGFGYTLGRRSAESANVDTAAASPETSSIGSPKPTAGSYFNQPAAPAPQPAQEVSASPPAQTDTASAVSAATLTPAKSAVSPADTMIVGDHPAAARPAPAASQVTTSSPQPATSSQPATGFVVQIAAVSSQDVADILISSLEKKGYTVAVRHEPQDKLLHVQIGPFPDKKQAIAMQQRVLADGFNAIVK
jgi:cell division septation protein DedD